MIDVYNVIWYWYNNDNNNIIIIWSYDMIDNIVW